MVVAEKSFQIYIGIGIITGSEAMPKLSIHNSIRLIGLSVITLLDTTEHLRYFFFQRKTLNLHRNFMQITLLTSIYTAVHEVIYLPAKLFLFPLH
jgi:hypothetical protein